VTVQVLLHVRKYHPITYNAILLNIIHNIFKGKYKTLNKTLKICVHSCPRFVLVMIFCTISADKYGWIINASNIIHTYWICMYDYAKLKLLPSGISDLSRFSLSCVGPLNFFTLKTYLSSSILDQGISRNASCALN
jgi:hypothetical protein